LRRCAAIATSWRNRRAKARSFRLALAACSPCPCPPDASCCRVQASLQHGKQDGDYSVYLAAEEISDGGPACRAGRRDLRA
jgi:hypothetical protein